MHIALEEAKKAYNSDEVPVGAILVRGDTLIARAHNTMHVNKNPLQHAEYLAIQKGLLKLNENHLRGCSLYVTLEPCCMCAGAIELVGIDKVYFGAYDVKMGQVDNNYQVLRHTRIEASGGFFETECATLLQNFFKKRR